VQVVLCTATFVIAQSIKVCGGVSAAVVPAAHSNIIIIIPLLLKSSHVQLKYAVGK